ISSNAPWRSPAVVSAHRIDLERHAAGCHSRRAQAPVIGGLLVFSVVIPRLRAYTANVEPSTPSSHDRVIVAAPIAESNIDQYKFEVIALGIGCSGFSLMSKG